YQPLRPEAPPLIREPERELSRHRPSSSPAERTAPTEALLGTPTDSIQNSRIEALEQALRQPTQHPTRARQPIWVALQDLQRDLGRRREDESRHGSSVGDRITAIETSLDNRLSELGHTINALSLRPHGAGAFDDTFADRI